MAKSNDIDVSKLKKRDLNAFARQLAKANTTIMNAICYAEELCNNEIFIAINRLDEDEKAEFLRKLAVIFMSVTKDEVMAEPETWGSDFQEFQSFGMEFQEFIDEV